MRPNTVAALGIRQVGKSDSEDITLVGQVREIAARIIKFLSNESITGNGRFEIYICRDLDSLSKVLDRKNKSSTSGLDLDSILSSDSLTDFEREFYSSLSEEISNG